MSDKKTSNPTKDIKKVKKNKVIKEELIEEVDKEKKK